MIDNVVSALRLGVETVTEATQVVVDVTVGRMLDTNPEKVR